jgi:threonine/homoserine/homoserine lactone efflux protein
MPLAESGLPLMLLAGAVAGFVSSAPPGAINLFVARAALERRERMLLPFLAGVLIADTLIAALAAWGYHAASDAARGAFGRWLEVGGGVVIAGLGAGAVRASLRPTPGPSPDASTDQRPSARLGPTRALALGLVMCGANPAFLLFWAFALQLVARWLPAPPGALATAAFVAGATLGDAAWFAAFLKLLRRGRDALAPRALGRVRLALALAFVAAGVAAVAKGISAA